MIRILCSGKLRFIRTVIWNKLEGPKPPIDFANNGCSCSPDFLSSGEAIWPACVIHDFQYGPLGGVSRDEADAIFRRNVYTVLHEQGVFSVRAAFWALVYWRAVRRFGCLSYRGGKA